MPVIFYIKVKFNDFIEKVRKGVMFCNSLVDKYLLGNF